MKKHPAWIAVLCVLSIVLLSGCGQSDDAAPKGQQGSSIAIEDPAIETIYKQNCLVCHGANLEGKMAPETNLQKVGSRMTKEQIYTQIAEGGKIMAPFNTKLTNEEINSLADWLAALK